MQVYFLAALLFLVIVYQGVFMILRERTNAKTTENLLDRLMARDLKELTQCQISKTGSEAEAAATVKRAEHESESYDQGVPVT